MIPRGTITITWRGTVTITWRGTVALCASVPFATYSHLRRARVRARVSACLRSRARAGACVFSSVSRGKSCSGPRHVCVRAYSLAGRSFFGLFKILGGESWFETMKEVASPANLRLATEGAIGSGPWSEVKEEPPSRIAPRRSTAQNKGGEEFHSVGDKSNG